MQAISNTITEGVPITYQVALSATPSDDVTVAMHPSWTGLSRDIAISPASIVFPAGQSKQWQTVTVDVPYTPSAMGTGSVSIMHTSFSDDVLFSTVSGVGVGTKSAPFTVLDIDNAGVCLGKCSEVTPYDFLFEKSQDVTATTTPYEVVEGEVMQTRPLYCICLLGDSCLNTSFMHVGSLADAALFLACCCL